MNNATKEFILWCLKQYSISGFKNLKRKDTKAKYDELSAIYPEVEMFDTLKNEKVLPPLKNK